MYIKRTKENKNTAQAENARGVNLSVDNNNTDVATVFIHNETTIFS